MIISHEHRFVFFHNPKAGGTSIRAAIGPFNDIGFGLWGADPDQTQGVAVDRAHLGIDEFAGLYPDLWDRVQEYRMFCLYRDPVARFMSSVSEHSKNFTSEDLRFTSPERTRHVVMAAIDRLEALGSADAVAGELDLTHFKPQHIYWSSAYHPVQMRAFPTSGIDNLFADLSAQTGTDIAPRHEKSAVSYTLPKTVEWLARQGGLRRTIGRMPATRWINQLAKRHFASHAGRRVALDDADRVRIDAFVRQFYAADFTPPSLPEPLAFPKVLPEAES